MNVMVFIRPLSFSTGVVLLTQAAEKTFFPRTSSGLVKEFGTADVLLIATAAIFSLVFAILEFPWFYGFNQGAILPVGLLIVAVPFILLMATYWAMGVIMPRSGNDYVWVGRMMHPSIGFAWSFVYMFAVFTTGYASSGVWALSSAVGTSTAVIGFLYNSQSLVTTGTWISTPVGCFSLSVLLTLFFAGLAIFGAKIIKRFLYVFWGVAVVGIVATWYLLSTTTPTDFATKWNTVLSHYATYSSLTTLATQQGWTVPAIGGLAATVAALPFAAFFLVGGNFVNVMAGEVKNAKRAIPIALMLSLFLTVTIWSITSTLTVKAVGDNWMYAVGYLYDNAPAAYANVVPFPPALTLWLSLIAYPNQFLVVLVPVLYVFGSLPGVFVYFWIPSRYFFAWSFDRIIPTKMAEVSKRYRTPHFSVLAVTVMAILVLALIAFTSFPTVETLGAVIWEVAFCVPAIATVIFPIRKKELLASAPGFMRKSIGGVPLISIIGGLTALGFGYFGYLAFVNPLITTPTLIGEVTTIGIVVACFAIYFVSSVYHKRRGVDMQMAFKEIPPV